MRILDVVILLSFYSCQMKEFDFEKAKEFNEQIDNSKQSTSKMPAFVLLDKEFMSATETHKLKSSYQQLTNSFLELNVITFIRFKNEVLFITRGNQENAEGYVLTTEVAYEDLPNLGDHYETVQETNIQPNWKSVELEKREFNE